MAADVPALTEFLRAADLTTSGLDSPTIALWIERDAGAIVASTGFELSADGRHALIRSVAVSAPLRGTGRGLSLAAFALERAREAGATDAWLFSRRSGGFWRKLGFTEATTDDVAAVLAETHQVRLFASTGQLRREVAWRASLG
ncbi:MAG: acetyltransferase [Microbacteriaceae bacterium]|nr:acetyltransferase [Microbacteriaceae bacterium]